MITATTRAISSTIGLAREKHLDRKERKAALSNPEQTEDSSSPNHPQDEVVVTDEQDWALDEAGNSTPSETSSQRDEYLPERTVSELVREADGQATEPAANQPRPRLPYPIVIPQRRPGTKSRGFARAYPPDLLKFGIEQETFLRFLKMFHSASQASPYLHALTIAASATSPIHGTITMAVSISVQIALGWARCP